MFELTSLTYNRVTCNVTIAHVQWRSMLKRYLPSGGYESFWADHVLGFSAIKIWGS